MIPRNFCLQDLICDLEFPTTKNQLNQIESPNPIPQIFSALGVFLIYARDLLDDPTLKVIYSNLNDYELNLLIDIFPEITWVQYNPNYVELQSPIILFDTQLDTMRRVNPDIGLLTDTTGKKFLYINGQISTEITSSMKPTIVSVLNTYLATAKNLKKSPASLKARIAKLVKSADNLIYILKGKWGPIRRNEYSLVYNKVINLVLKPTVQFEDIAYRLTYCPSNDIKKTSLHIGQRKLFMNELQFLTQYTNPAEKVLCVYAGAAPSNKTGLLSDLFPNVTFLLVDPNPFVIVGKKPIYLSKKNLFDYTEATQVLAKIGTAPIYIINGLFTNVLATAVSKITSPVVFISDIRTVQDSTGIAKSFDVIWNQSMQYNWVVMIKPRASMLKFRHPFYEDLTPDFRKLCETAPYAADFKLSKKYGIDFVTNAENRHLVYLAGTIYIQPWAGISSTESRLVVDNILEIQDLVNFSEYEDKFYYYNNIERFCVNHYNDNADKSLGFDHCNDCALENYIWKKYLLKHPSTYNVKTLVTKLSAITSRGLLRDTHGKLFE